MGCEEVWMWPTIAWLVVCACVWWYVCMLHRVCVLLRRVWIRGEVQRDQEVAGGKESSRPVAGCCSEDRTQRRTSDVGGPTEPTRRQHNVTVLDQQTYRRTSKVSCSGSVSIGSGCVRSAVRKLFSIAHESTDDGRCLVVRRKVAGTIRQQRSTHGTDEEIAARTVEVCPKQFPDNDHDAVRLVQRIASPRCKHCTGKPSRYITNHQRQLSLPSLRGG